MTRFARSTKAVVGVALGMLALGAGFEACSSSSGGTPEGFNGNDGSTGGGNDGGGVKTTCANPTLNIIFSPMYSAYIPGSTTHTFQIPAVLDDGSTATWSVSDTSKASLMTQTLDGDPGVMVTVTGTGTVTVIATKSDGSCGTSTLNITSATENDWQTGNSRYNDGVALHFGRGDGGFMRPDGGFGEGGFMRPEGGMGGGGGFGGDSGCSPLDRGYDGGGLACTNCHGPTAMSLFNDVSHTPEQTGGFSDDDLINIIVNGEIPDGGYFDPTVLDPSCDGAADCTQQALKEWQGLHRWCDITPDEYNGIVVYLRSLTPAPQNGTSNFGGGHHHHDGGGGGGPMGDSGGPPPNNDSGPGPSNDAASE